ncbi:P-loop containing nucleoside triphosphate hydrolase protein [Gonapodya prolifera JEL478]|uniref:Midasin n=1 Tax=Gonapodya prolifera (strain JEL478) TaxID=1344416 RepID=A0A139AQL8_GONPJ|nr:P-loop containing nucleoside triphosphate hydrolase protein [Gonapodya prolifera JEL478]|eukprot:KXS18954.1 P-loop containing nucleoside triphosphate hydrolase protein [Gonapodya prolifera JEL478]
MSEFAFDASAPLALLLDHIQSGSAFTSDGAGLGQPLRHLVKLGRHHLQHLFAEDVPEFPKRDFEVWYGDLHVEPDNPDDPYPEGAIDDEPDYLLPKGPYGPSYDSFFVPSPSIPGSPTYIDKHTIDLLTSLAKAGTHTSSDRAILLNALSDLLLNPFLTFPIIRDFTPLVPDLVARWRDRHPGVLPTSTAESGMMRGATPTHLRPSQEAPMSPKRDRRGNAVGAMVEPSPSSVRADDNDVVMDTDDAEGQLSFTTSEAVALALCRIGAAFPEIFDFIQLFLTPLSGHTTSLPNLLLPLSSHPHRTVRTLVLRCQQLLRGWTDPLRTGIERRQASATLDPIDLSTDDTETDLELRRQLERDAARVSDMVESGFLGVPADGDVGDSKVVDGSVMVRVDQFWREEHAALVERVEYNGTLAGAIDYLLDTYVRILPTTSTTRSSTAPSSSIHIGPGDLHPSLRTIHRVLLALPPVPTSPRRAPDGPWVEVQGREAVLEGIARGLQEGVPVCVFGGPGVGKTRAVEEVAEKCGVSGDLLKLPLTASTPTTHLLGTHTTDPLDPSRFSFRPGLLQHCMVRGKWILLEDLHSASPEVAQLVKAISERVKPGGVVELDGGQVRVHRGFRMLATATVQAQRLDGLYGMGPWKKVEVPDYRKGDLESLVAGRHPGIASLAALMCTAWEAIVERDSKMGRKASPRDLFRFCKRTEEALRALVGRDLELQDTQRIKIRQAVLKEAVDVFCAPIGDTAERDRTAKALAASIGLVQEAVISPRVPTIAIESDGSITVGRVHLQRSQRRQPGGAQVEADRFAMTPSTSRTMEQIAVAVHLTEPVLLVGETGAGKTTAVQAIAKMCGHKLSVVNLSQQAEASDLLGGYKPVDVRGLAMRARERFQELFERTFPVGGNEAFIRAVGKAVQESDWGKLVKGFRTGYDMALKVISKNLQRDSSRSKRLKGAGTAVHSTGSLQDGAKASRDWSDLEREWTVFASQIEILEGQTRNSKNALLFSFIEGTLPVAIQRGDWILLDEINLASAETLEALSTLLQSSSESILLADRGDTEAISRHPDFRLFACMNPANDVGKRDLPDSLRSRFTELFVDSPDGSFEDLKLITSQYLSEFLVSASDTAITTDVSKFYSKCKELALSDKIYDGSGARITFTLRTLTRMLTFAAQISGTYGLRRGLWEGAVMLFMTQLDDESRIIVEKIAIECFLSGIRNPSAFVSQIPQAPLEKQGSFERFRSFWLERGDVPIMENATEHYVITPSVERNLENLARAVLCKRFPVLIQGPTSSGKTSMIEYLAGKTGHKFVRVNNHEHTDLQEYIGSYVSDDVGKLKFQEGVLVEALRNGHWIVLDELNLAPSDVLEALNRLLDDNRELLIPETGEVVRPHPRFMLFATQNPPGLYGGRKVLSRAFRNRFLELHFADIPENELEEILYRRSRIAPSYAKRLVAVYRELQTRRANTKLFEGRQGFITLRDLFRWAGRNASNYDELAQHGFMILGERARKEEEKVVVKNVLEDIMKVKIEEHSLYSCKNLPVWNDVQRFREMAEPPRSSPEHRHWMLVQGVVWSKPLLRLLTLVQKCLDHNEPVLLVGETGCGKTTICDVISAVSSCPLVTVNCQQHTETSDFLGGQRPLRERERLCEELRSGLNTVLQQHHDFLMHSFKSDANDITRKLMSATLSDLLQMGDTILKSMLEHKDVGDTLKDALFRLQRLTGKCRSLFSWQDGPLIQAMKNGHLFLLDEISLAEDAVLERLNSVLEPGRTILLAEKGGVQTEEVTAVKGFQFLATMNPGGDFGKKELSPALRNRFTEIWVPQIVDVEDLRLIIKDKVDVDAPEINERVADGILGYVGWFGRAVQMPIGAIVSLRDLLAWVQFVNLMARDIGLKSAFEHGGCMVLLDSIPMNPMLGHMGNKKQLEDFKALCAAQLEKVAITVYANMKFTEHENATLQTEPTRSGNLFSVPPFSIPLGSEPLTDPVFAFQAPTTRMNAMRVLRGMQLRKPILLEGSPGVGKTSLIANLSAVTGNRLVRINLSDQTDLMDLFGSDLPVEGGKAGEFAWRDGPFLRAMQDGAWVLLDELNLASQSVLEGLNACLDYRATVYITELDKTFECSSQFRVFAAQNPQQQGGGRKGLPKSFVNRFSQVYIDTLTASDLLTIGTTLHPDFPRTVWEDMIRFNATVHEKTVVEAAFARSGSPWEFNLRDVLRWVELCRRHPGSSPWEFVDIIYTHRMRTRDDRSKLLELVWPFVKRAPPSNVNRLGFQITPTNVIIGDAVLPRNATASFGASAFLDGNFVIPYEYLPEVKTLMKCVEMNWMAIIVGSARTGKTSLVHLLASLTGNTLHEFSMNSSVDTMELLGGFNQVDIVKHKSAFFDHVDKAFEDLLAQTLLHRPEIPPPHLQNALTAWENAKSKFGGPDNSELSMSERQTALRSAICQFLDYLDQFFLCDGGTKAMRTLDLREQLERIVGLEEEDARGVFEWSDGALVRALENGDWILLDNANLCASAVLDRLNSLFEDRGVLVMSERGFVNGQAVKVIKPHQNFRIFLTMDPNNGGEISRAMRNRGIEVALLDDGRFGLFPTSPLNDGETDRHGNGDNELISCKGLGLLGDRPVSVPAEFLTWDSSAAMASLGASYTLRRICGELYPALTVSNLDILYFGASLPLRWLGNGGWSVTYGMSLLSICTYVSRRTYRLRDLCRFIILMKKTSFASSRRESDSYSPLEAGDFLTKLALSRYRESQICSSSLASKAASMNVIQCAFAHHHGYLPIQRLPHVITGQFWALLEELRHISTVESLPSIRSITWNERDTLKHVISRRVLDLDETVVVTRHMKRQFSPQMFPPSLLEKVKKLSTALGSDILDILGLIWSQSAKRVIKNHVNRDLWDRLVSLVARSDANQYSRTEWKALCEAAASIRVLDNNASSQVDRLRSVLTETVEAITTHIDDDNVDSNSKEMQKKDMTMCSIEDLIFAIQEQITMSKLYSSEVSNHDTSIRSLLDRAPSTSRSPVELGAYQELLWETDDKSRMNGGCAFPSSTWIESRCGKFDPPGNPIDIGIWRDIRLTSSRFIWNGAFNADPSLSKGLGYAAIWKRNLCFGSEIALGFLCGDEHATYVSFTEDALGGVSHSHGKIREIFNLVATRTGLSRLRGTGDALECGLEELQKGFAVVGNQGIMHRGLSWVYVGIAFLLAFCPVVPVDPAAETIVRHRLGRAKLARTEDENTTRDVIRRVVPTLLDPIPGENVEALRREVKDATLVLPVRPVPSQMPDLCSDMQNFETELLGPLGPIHSLLKDLPTMRTDKSIELRESLLQQNLLFHATRLRMNYPLYADLTNGLEQAILWIKYGLRLARVAYSSGKMNLSSGKSNAILGLLTFPTTCAVRLEQLNDILTEVHSASEAIRVRRDICIGLLLEVSTFYWTQSPPVRAMGGILTQASKVFETVTSIWLQQEAAQHEKEEKAQEQYKYRMREEHIPSEVDVEHSVIASMLPTFWDSEELTIAKPEDNLFNDDYKEPVFRETQPQKVERLSAEDAMRVVIAHRRLFDNDFPQCNGSDTRTTLIKEAFSLLHRSGMACINDTGVFLSRSKDETTVGGHLFGSHLFEQILSGGYSHHEGEYQEGKPYDFYHDANLKEVFLVKEPLGTLSGKVKVLLESWPEHPALLDIATVAERIENFSLQSPISKFLTGVELLFQKCNMWEEVASRANSVRDSIDSLITLIVRWRKLELHSWRDLFSLQDYKSNCSASKLWFHLYRTLIVVITDSTPPDTIDYKSLVSLLSQLCKESPIGEFSLRLQMLSTFAKQLYHSMTYDGNLRGNESIARIFSIVWNVFQNFKQFQRLVDQAKSDRRGPIEREIQEYVKVASWKDVNSYALMESAMRSHRQLAKFVKRYADILATPASSIIEFSSKETNLIETRPESSSDRLAMIRGAFDKPDDDRTINVDSKSSRRATRLEGHYYTAKSQLQSVQNQATRLGGYAENISLLHSEMRPNSSDGVQQPHSRQIVKNTKSVRRKLLNDLLRGLHAMGLSVRELSSFLKVRDSFALLEQHAPPSEAHMTLFGRIFFGNSGSDITSAWDSINSEYFRTFDALSRFRARIPQAHKDMSPTDLNRMLSLGEHICLLMLRSRGRIALMNHHLVELDGYFASMIELNVEHSSHIVDGLWGRMALDLSKAISDFDAALEQVSVLWKSDLMAVQSSQEAFESDNSYIAFLDLVSSLRSAKESCFSTECSIFSQQCDIEPFISARVINHVTSLENTLETHMDKLVKTSHAFPTRIWKLIEGIIQRVRGAMAKVALDKSSEARVSEGNSSSSKGEVERALRRQREVVMLAIQDILAMDWRTTIKGIADEPPNTDDGPSVTRLDILCEKIAQRLAVAKVASAADGVKRSLSSFHTDSTVAKDWENLSKTLKEEAVWVEYYSRLARQVCGTLITMHANLVTLGANMLSLMNQLIRSGFGVADGDDNPEEGAENQQTTGGLGLGDGDGVKNISNQVEDDEDLEDAKRPEDRQKAQEKDDQADKKDGKNEAVEVDEDFEASYEDVEDQEDNDERKSETEDPDLDERFGDLDPKLSEDIDQRLWGDDPISDEDKEQQQSTGPGAGDPMEDLVASKESKVPQDEQPKSDKGPLNNSEAADDNQEGKESEDEAGEELEGSDINESSPAKDEQMGVKDVNEQDGMSEFDLPDDMQLEEDNGDVEASERTEDKDEKTEEEPGPSHDAPDADVDLKEAGDNLESGETEQDATSQPNVPVPMESGVSRDDEAPGGTGSALPSQQKPDKTEGRPNGEKEESEDAKTANLDSKKLKESLPNSTTDEKLDQRTADRTSDVYLPQHNPDSNAEEWTGQQKRDWSNDVNPNRDLGVAIETWHRRLKEIVRKNQYPVDIADGPSPEDRRMDPDSTFEFVESDGDPTIHDAQVLAGATEEQARQSAQQKFGDPASYESTSADEMDIDESDKVKENPFEDPTPVLQEGRLEASETREGHKSKASDRVDSEINHEGNQNEAKQGEGVEQDDLDDDSGTNAEDVPLDDSGVVEINDYYDYTVKDYDALRRDLEDRFASWRQEGANESNSMQLWKQYERLTQDAALTLSERLRLILEPTVASKLKGDYKTGKRLSMRKIIPYIASGFRKDKIWLRRTKPNKRAYQIMVAIDDSESMADSGAGGLAFESLATISQALRLLEVGEISVVRFGEDVALLHPFEKPFGGQSGAEVVRGMDFKQKKTNVRALLETSLQVMEEARRWNASGSTSTELWQLEIVVSDGVCEDHETLRALVQRALENKILVVFVVVDRRSEQDSIVNMTNVSYTTDKSGRLVLKMDKYVTSFGKAFPYYLVVRDVGTLVGTLATTLQQFFSVITRE